MRVLVACEFSGAVRQAFRDRGHEAWSCDLLDAADGSRYHFKRDILSVLHDDTEWDLLIAHPPCTYLTNSGVRWLHTEPGRWDRMIDGAMLFKTLLCANIKRKAIENPIMHRYAREIVGRRADQYIQPWMFGHPEQKATGLWLENLPKLVETNNVREAMMALPLKERQRVWWQSPGKDRWARRAVTFPGIADAMAEQWGGLE